VVDGYYYLITSIKGTLLDVGAACRQAHCANVEQHMQKTLAKDFAFFLLFLSQKIKVISLMIEEVF